jgi:hypothetical protein
MYFVFTAWKIAMCTRPLVHNSNYHTKEQICEGVTKIRQSDTTDFTGVRSVLFIRWAQLAAKLISLCNIVLQVFPFHWNGTYSNLNYSNGTVYAVSNAISNTVHPLWHKGSSLQHFTYNYLADSVTKKKRALCFHNIGVHNTGLFRFVIFKPFHALFMEFYINVILLESNPLLYSGF